MWPEVSKVKEEKRRELLLDGKEVSKKIADGGLDEDIFSLTEVNFMRISNTCLAELDPRISELAEKLTNLDLHDNKLVELPDSLSTLANLKLLDLSGNGLRTLPESVCKLENLLTLNLNRNNLESLPDFSGLTNLHELFVSNNKLAKLPDGIESLSQLLLLKADHNGISMLPEAIHELVHLKELTLSDNMLTVLPFSMVLLDKLRVLDLRGNKFSDRRLLKLANVDQTQPKGVFKFLKPLYDKQKVEAGKASSSKGGKKAGGHQSTKTDETEDAKDWIQVLHCADAKATGVEVKITENVASVRPYIVCCIIRNIDLQKTATTFKQFIAFQTRLHESVCEKRLIATIATHDIRSIKSPLRYDGLNPDQTMLVPLGRQKALSAAEFMKKLQKEADEQRKAKKRNTTTGIHKYLDLLKDKPVYPFLCDKEDLVISFPPITNCEFTKISAETKDILVEVTSSKNLNICKQVMEQVIMEVYRLDIGASLNGSGAAAADSDSEDEEVEHCLVVEQVRVTDMDGNLKTVYPSKIDLLDVPVQVRRPTTH